MARVLKKILISVFILISFIALYSCDSSHDRVIYKKGNIAPDFSLEDLNGQKVRLSDYRGKVVLLDFWATWCPPCLDMVPELISIQDKYSDKDFIVLSVSLDSGNELTSKLSEFSKDYGINYPILFGDEKIKKTYRLFSIPTNLMIDKQGKILYFHMGYIDDFGRKISEELDKII